MVMFQEETRKEDPNLIPCDLKLGESFEDWQGVSAGRVTEGNRTGERVTKVGVWVDSGSGDSSSQSLRQWILQLIPTLLGPVLITGSGCLCESRAGP